MFSMVLESNKSLYSKSNLSFNQKLEKTDEVDENEEISKNYKEATSVDEIVDKVKQIMRASNKTLQQLFLEIDIDGSGSVSNLEFRNCIKKMKLGLTSREIDLLLNTCDENMDGKVDVKEFMKKFQTS